MKKSLFNRVASLLLAIMMVLGVLAGCNRSNPQEPTSGQNTTIAPTQAQTQAPTTTTPVKQEITIKLHYLRADGNYDGWNVWLWTTGDGTAYNFSKTADDNGVVTEAKFAAGTETIGYIVRLNSWDAKDIDEDQFIDVSSIYAGTVDVYVTSGKKGCKTVFGSDCVDASGNTPSETTAPGQNGGSTSNREWVDVEYVYNQELNVVEDNFRNYYEIFVRSFYDSDGNGTGDFKGVTAKLDYVAELGFNAIWFMPVMQSPTYHKYDVVDYCSIDREYGTLEDFSEMVAAAHERNIRVIIDMVINHSSSKHPWFTEACSYLAALGADEEPDATVCPSVTYYHFTREKKNATYYAVPGTGNKWYYEGQFESGMPDLNLADEGLRKELEKVADFWINLGVDGFRMDAALHYEENDRLYNCEVLNWLYTYCCTKNPDFYMVSEVWTGSSEIDSYYASETPSMFNFGVAGAENIIVRAAKGKASVRDFAAAMVNIRKSITSVYKDAIDAPFISNHDMVRISNMLVNNETAMKYAAGLLLTMNGSPFVYYGDEIGMASKGTSDPNKRLPMIWSKSDKTGITWNPTGADQGITSSFEGVEEQLADPGSLLNYYKRALQLRNENPEIARGDVEIINGFASGNQSGVTKTWNGSTIALVYNNAAEPVTVDISGMTISGMQIRGYLTVNGAAVELVDNQLTLPAFAIVVLK